MKISPTSQVFVFFFAMLTFGIPAVTLAQQTPIEVIAKKKARVDAANDVNKTSWFRMGCFLNILGVVIAELYAAPVPADRLVGKSPVYVIAYTSNYRARRTEIQTESAMKGFITGSTSVGGLAGLIYLGYTYPMQTACCVLGSVGCIGIVTHELNKGSSWCF